MTLPYRHSSHWFTYHFVFPLHTAFFPQNAFNVLLQSKTFSFLLSFTKKRVNLIAMDLNVRSVIYIWLRILHDHGSPHWLYLLFFSLKMLELLRVLFVKGCDIFLHWEGTCVNEPSVFALISRVDLLLLQGLLVLSINPYWEESFHLPERCWRGWRVSAVLGRSLSLLHINRGPLVGVLACR